MQDTFSLKYRTSGTSGAGLKRKVFCAYHPSDARLLEEVFRDLSAACECTLFYYEPGKEPADNARLEEDLASMNLFVLPVTSDFLFKPCFANSAAYTFAVKHAIPVLPILFESGLEFLFNEKIGNLQCLSKVQEAFDATAVPYREKLSNYLSQTLSADVDIKRCAAAFDASIFLSYRKKRHGESYPLSRYANLQLTESVDHFVGSFVTRVRIQSNSGSSGGGGGGGFSGGSRGRR